MATSPYRDQHERQQAELDRQVVRLLEAAAPFGDELATTAEVFVRKYPVLNTGIRYARSVTRYLAWCQERGIDPLRVREGHAGMFVASLHGLCAGSQRNYLVALKGFYRSAKKDGLIADNPYAEISTAEVDPETRTPALTKEQLLAVLRPLRLRMRTGTATLVEARDFTAIFLAARIGARRASITDVRWSGWVYDGRSGVLTFTQKGRRGHSLRMTPDVIEVIEAWRRRLELALGREVHPGEPIFPRLGLSASLPAEHPLVALTGRSLLDAVRARFLAVGIRGYRIGFHTLRATSATLAFLDGATVPQIGRTGGWRSDRTVERYLRCELPTALGEWGLDELDDEPAA